MNLLELEDEFGNRPPIRVRGKRRFCPMWLYRRWRLGGRGVRFRLVTKDVWVPQEGPEHVNCRCVLP